MEPVNVTLNVRALAARWWIPVVRGVAAILFGILAFVLPGVSLLSLVVVWGAYALVDGLLNLLLFARRGRAGVRSGWLALEGVLSVAAGVFALLWPGMTALALLSIIAVWAVFTGVAEVAAAVRLRRELEGEWMLALTGVLSIALGVMLLLYPASGALAFMWIVGSYALLFGGLLVALGLRLQRFMRVGPSTKVAL